MSVKLQKGHKISLAKGSDLKKGLFFGLGWDAPTTGRNVDLDANAILFDEGKNELGTVWFRNKSVAGVAHSGDNLTGAGEGDDEKIIVEPSKLAANVKSVVFTVASYSGHTFTEVQNAFIRIVNLDTGVELAKFQLSESFKETGLIMGRLYKHGEEWKFAALGLPANGRTVQDQLAAVKANAL